MRYRIIANTPLEVSAVCLGGVALAGPGRQTDIYPLLDLIVGGRLNKQIADALGISIKTVEVHRARVMEKMGVASLAELVQQVVVAETTKH